MEKPERAMCYSCKECHSVETKPAFYAHRKRLQCRIEGFSSARCPINEPVCCNVFTPLDHWPEPYPFKFKCSNFNKNCTKYDRLDYIEGIIIEKKYFIYNWTKTTRDNFSTNTENYRQKLHTTGLHRREARFH